MAACIYIYTCACDFLSRHSCLYNIICILVQLIYVHLHVHNSILLLSPFLRLSLLSLYISLSFPNASVLYTYFPCSVSITIDIHVHVYCFLVVHRYLCHNTRIKEEVPTKERLYALLTLFVLVYSCVFKYKY